MKLKTQKDSIDFEKSMTVEADIRKPMSNSVYKH